MGPWVQQSQYISVRDTYVKEVAIYSKWLYS